MEITESKPRDDVVVLSLNGRLDPTTVRTVETRLGQALEGGARHVIFDLEGLDYISSAGLRVVLMGAKRLQATSGKLVLCAPKRNVKEVFDISGFSTILTICSGQQEALDILD